MDGKQPGVDIDLGGLRMAADSLRVRTEHGWRPGVARANLELDHGIRFGLACPGGQIAAARDLFGLALERALENTARQITAAGHLARRLDAVLATDAEADGEAAQRMGAGLHE